MPASKRFYLSSGAVFRDLSAQEMAEIERATTTTTCEAGRVFYRPGESGEALFLLKQGDVLLYRLSPGGKKIVVDTLGPGAIFGEMALLGLGMHDAVAEAHEECRLSVMSRADVERLILSRPAVALRFVEALGQRLRNTEARLEEIAFKGIPARLAALLLRLAGAPGGTVVSGYTHQELGEMLGAYRETTTQALNAFKAQGLIAIGRKRIEILDRAGLEAVAEE